MSYFTHFQRFFQTKRHIFALFLVLSFTFLVYLKTLAPTYTWQHWGSDAGDFIACVYTLGIPHPPGTPLYVLITQPFRFLPWGDPAYKLNFASTVFAVGGVGVLFLIVFKLTKSITASCLASLFFAFNRVFWGQAVITEVYTLNALLVGVVTYFLMRWTATNNFPFYLALFFFGLALSNHTSSVLLAPAIFYLVLAKCGKKVLRPRFLFSVFCFLLFGLSPYLYLPLRARMHPSLNWGNPETLKAFIAHVTAQEYGKMLFYKTQVTVLGNLINFFLSLIESFNLLGLFLGFIGVFFNRKKYLSPFFIFVFLFYTLFNVNYKIPNIETFFLPAFFVFSLWVGLGTKVVLEIIQKMVRLLGKKWPLVLLSIDFPPRLKFPPWEPSLAQFMGFLLTLGLFAGPIVSLKTQFSKVDLNQDFEVANYGKGVFRVLEKNAIVLTEGDKFTLALDYFRWVVYKDRKDVAVFPNGIYLQDWRVENVKRLYPWLTFPDLPTAKNEKEALQTMLALIEANWEKYPIYLTLDYPPPKEDYSTRTSVENWIIESVGPIYKIVGKKEE